MNRDESQVLAKRGESAVHRRGVVLTRKEQLWDVLNTISAMVALIYCVNKSTVLHSCDEKINPPHDGAQAGANSHPKEQGTSNEVKKGGTLGRNEERSTQPSSMWGCEPETAGRCVHISGQP